jgi:hypothetical protein
MAGATAEVEHSSAGRKFVGQRANGAQHQLVTFRACSVAFEAWGVKVPEPARQSSRSPHQARTIGQTLACWSSSTPRCPRYPSAGPRTARWVPVAVQEVVQPACLTRPERRRHVHSRSRTTTGRTLPRRSGFARTGVAGTTSWLRLSTTGLPHRGHFGGLIAAPSTTRASPRFAARIGWPDTICITCWQLRPGRGHAVPVNVESLR